jgi:hypothetical protein
VALHMTREMLADITCRMGEYVRQFISPISEILSPVEGSAWGSGTYLRLRGRVYLLTNEHVARKLDEAGLAHLPREGVEYVRVNNPMQAEAYPVDAAVAWIDDKHFAAATKQALAADRVQRTDERVRGELLLVCGFPGFSTPRFWPDIAKKRRGTVFDLLHTPAVPYLTQEAPVDPPGPDEYDPEYHFALHYPTQPVERTEGRPAELPDPHGISGSLVWNTNYMASAGAGWNPDLATVCGLVWSVNDVRNILVATRIQHVRRFLIRAFRLEAAYFRSLRRDMFPGDALSDWLWAEREITDLA